MSRRAALAVDDPFAAADAADLARPAHRSDPDPSLPPLVAEDAMPPGPYRRALTRYPGGQTGRPYIIRAGDGRCIVGWIDSRDVVDAVVAALNAQFPS